MNTNVLSFEVVREATFAAARADGVIGAATLMGMAGKAKFDNGNLNAVSIDEYRLVKEELHEKLDDFFATRKAETQDELRMLFMQQRGQSRELVGERLPDLLLDANLAFEELGFEPITAIDNNPMPVRMSTLFWNPEMTSADIAVMTCKVCNIPVAEDGGRIDPENS